MPTRDPTAQRLIARMQEQQGVTADPEPQGIRTQNPIARKMIERMVAKNKQTEFKFREPSFVESVGRGSVDVTRGIKQLFLNATNPEKAKKYQEEQDRELALYEHNQGDGFDWGRLTGQAGMTAPIGMYKAPAHLFGKVIAGGAEGALAAGSLYTKENESRLGNAQAGALGGAAVPPVLAAGKKVAEKAIHGASRLSGLAMNSPQLTSKVTIKLKSMGFDLDSAGDQAKKNLINEAKKQVSATGTFDEQALLRKAEAEGLGFTGDSASTTSQLTRDPRQWADERNLSKLGDEGEPIRGRYMNQGRRFAELESEVVGAIPDKDVFTSGENIVSAVNKKWNESQKVVGRLYNEIRKKHGGMTGARLDGFARTLDDLSDSAEFDQITESVKRRLDKFGEIEGGLTVDQAEGFRKWIGGLSANSPTLGLAKKRLIEALDNDVIDGIGDDVFKTARDAARARFKDFETKLTKGIVQGKLPPDKMYRNITTANVADLQGLKANLLTTDYGRGAWERMRQQVIAGLWKKSMKQGDMSEFIGSSYSNALDSIGDARLKVLFSPEELAKLQQIARVGKNMTYTPPYAAVNWSNTTPAMVNLARQAKVMPLISDWMGNIANRIEVDQALSGKSWSPAQGRAAEHAFGGLLDSLLSTPVGGFAAQTLPIAGGLAAQQKMKEKAR